MPSNQRASSPVQGRKVLRVVHLVLAIAAGFAVYSPGVSDALGRQVLAVVVIPGLTLTGMWIWQQARVRRLVRRLRARGPARGGVASADVSA